MKLLRAGEKGLEKWRMMSAGARRGGNCFNDTGARGARRGRRGGAFTAAAASVKVTP
ncbi:hypothetical protein [Janthinobacterium sp.]|uniref:hypothetical protein n=1 Tax=Janthinobacterium sp. TaxID=1871054 RepID=UPI00293D8ED1|nr:hypothetical protein [Janthinobacterium sp.]